MIPPSEFEPFDKNNVLFSEDTWETLFGETLKARPAASHALGLLLYDLLNAISDGDKSTEKVINTLKSGIEWLYRHSPVSGAAFVAFLHYLDGTLPDVAAFDRLLTESARPPIIPGESVPPRRHPVRRGRPGCASK
ncbi:MAG: hypothetical protein ACREDR_02970 [Blastocatellia bacterium]